MKPIINDRLPYCSLTCDEIQNFEGRRVCRLTHKAVTTKATEDGVLCVPAVDAMYCTLAKWQDAAANPGCKLLRSVVAG